MRRYQKQHLSSDQESLADTITHHGFQRLVSLARPYRWQIVIIMILSVLSSALTLVYPALTGKVIDIVILKDLSAFQTIIIFLVVAAIFQTTIGFWKNVLTSATGERVVINLRLQLYDHLQKLPLRFFQDNRSGELLSRLTNDVTLVRAAVTQHIVTAIQSVITLVLGLAIVIIGSDTLLAQMNQFNINIPSSSSTLSPLNTFLLIAGSLIPMVIVPIIASRFTRRYVRKELKFLSDTTAAAEEAISNAKTVKSFSKEEYEFERYRALTSQQFAMTKKRILVSGVVDVLTGIMAMGGMVLFLWYAGSAVLKGELSIGSLSATVLYFGFFTRPFISLGMMYGEFQITLGAVERLFDLLGQPVVIEDQVGAIPLPTIGGEITFDHVEFGYDEDVRVLHDVSFKARSGQVVALVGPSGAGKTTIANLIPRFYDIQKGSISIDGHDLRHVQLKSLREQIGIVLQEPVLFGSSVRENIAYGCLDASDEAIEAAARAANAHEFILELPDGYQTLVGERGVKLSGGQRQRIAIARALLRNPRILILDEATSSLDNESEHLVQSALEHLMKNRTTIVIAHRLSTIQNADKIIVIEKGHIVEEGSHAELLAHGQTYYRLYTHAFWQASAEETSTATV